MIFRQLAKKPEVCFHFSTLQKGSVCEVMDMFFIWKLAILFNFENILPPPPVCGLEEPVQNVCPR